MVRLGDYVSIRTGKLDANASSDNGIYPFFTCSKEPLKIDTYSYDCECVLVAGNGDLNVKYYSGKFDAYQRTYIVESKNKDILSVRYLFYFLNKYLDTLRGESIGGVIKYIKLGNLTEAKFPLSPLDKQRKIAAVLDKVSDLIAKRRQQLDKLDLLVKSKFVEMFGDPVSNPKGWKKFPLGKRCEIVTGNTPSRAEPKNYGNYIEWIKSDNINTPHRFLTTAQEGLSEEGFQKCRYVDKDALLMTCIAGSINCIGNVAISDRRVAFNQQINAVVPNNDQVVYLYWMMLLSKPYIHSTINMALKGILSKGQLSEMEFPFPPLELQREFVAFAEQTEKSKSTIQKSLEKLETLKKVLMQEYFE